MSDFRIYWVTFLETFFSPQHILQRSNGYFKENYNFSRFQGGSNIFSIGGSIPIEAY